MAASRPASCGFLAGTSDPAPEATRSPHAHPGAPTRGPLLPGAPRGVLSHTRGPPRGPHAYPGPTHGPGSPAENRLPKRRPPHTRRLARPSQARSSELLWPLFVQRRAACLGDFGLRPPPPHRACPGPRSRAPRRPAPSPACPTRAVARSGAESAPAPAAPYCPGARARAPSPPAQGRPRPADAPPIGLTAPGRGLRGRSLEARHRRLRLVDL